MTLASMIVLASSAAAQWKKLAISGTGIFYNEIFFIDNDHGWITQNSPRVLMTTDGGTTWQASFLTGGSTSFNRDICFLDRRTGFISGEDGVWKTFDGGNTWINITPNNIPGNILGSVWFISPEIGVCGFGSCDDEWVTFCRTTNGGASWDRVSYRAGYDATVGGITYQNGVFYAAGGGGKFWASTDNGASWSQTSTGSNGWQEDLISANNVLFTASASGNSCGTTGGGNIMRSADGGRSWVNRFFPGVVMWGVTMYSPTEGWVCGDGGRAYKTTDGGFNWKEHSCGLDPNDRIDDIFFTDPTHGWAVGNGIYQYSTSVTEAGPDMTICRGGSVTLEGRGTGFYSWTPSAGLSCTSCPNPVATPTRTTTYYFNVYGIAGCEGTDSVTVTVVDPPKVLAAGDSTICAGESIPLTASGGNSYRWSPSAGLSCTDCPNPIASPTVTTTYIVTAINGSDCSDIDSVVVTVNSVDADAGPDSALCIGNTVQLSASGGIAYRWHPSPDLSCVECPNPVVTTSTTATYAVDVVGANGCVATDSVTITIVPLPVPDIAPEATICEGESIQLVEGSGSERHRWTPSTGLSCADCPSPIATPDSTTTYYVTAINANGCESTDSITVVVKPITLQFTELPGGVFTFDTTELTATTCRELLMRNTGPEPLIISSPWLFRNMEFSVPPGQLPIVIPPGGEGRMTICYTPSADIEQRDTLVIPTECTRRVPLAAYGKRFAVSDGIICGDTRIRIGGLGAAGQILKVQGPTPNPSSSSRIGIEFVIGREGRVRLVVHNAIGQQVASVVDATMSSGKHSVVWDAAEMPSGLYYYTLSSEDESVSSTIYLMK